MPARVLFWSTLVAMLSASMPPCSSGLCLNSILPYSDLAAEQAVFTAGEGMPASSELS